MNSCQKHLVFIKKSQVQCEANNSSSRWAMRQRIFTIIPKNLRYPRSLTMINKYKQIWDKIFITEKVQLSYEAGIKKAYIEDDPQKTTSVRYSILNILYLKKFMSYQCWKPEQKSQRERVQVVEYLVHKVAKY